MPSRVSPAASEPFAVSALRSDEPTNGGKFWVRAGSMIVVPHLRVSDGGRTSASTGIGSGSPGNWALAGVEAVSAPMTIASAAPAALPPMGPMVRDTYHEYHHFRGG